MSRKIKVNILITAILLLVVSIFAGTYAYMGNKPEVINSIAVTGSVINTSEGINLTFSGDKTLTLNITNDNLSILDAGKTYIESSNPNVTLTLESDATKYPTGVTCEYSVYYEPTNVYRPSAESLSNNLNEYTIIASNSIQTYDEKNLANISTKTKLFSSTITSGNINHSNSVSWNIKTRFYNLNVNQADAMGQTPSGTLSYEIGKCYAGASATAVCNSGTSMANCVKSLYTSDGENNLYLHDGKGKYTNSDLEAGDNNYRYSGANPNNFVCFGTDETPCPSDNLYRIIGVIDGRVKLIKYDNAMQNNLLGRDGDAKAGYGYTTESPYKGDIKYARYPISTYYWNNSNNYDENNADTTKSTNDWEESNLNKINLNTNYLKNIGSAWANMIDDTYWNIEKPLPNGTIYNTNANITYNNLYKNNYTKTSVSSKVALMDITDYYYAASPTNWSKSAYTNKTTNRPDLNGNFGDEYDYNSAVNDNWIYMGVREWTLTAVNDEADGPYDIAYLRPTGSIGWSFSYRDYSIRPVFYLKNNILYSSGEGTKDNPYIIADNIEDTSSYHLTCNDTSLACTIAKKYTTDGEGDLYYHDRKGNYTNASLETFDNGYRYSGANPNNYVCFGSDESTCPDDNLYRAIGIINGKVKLIKWDYASKNLLGQDGDAEVGYGFNTTSRPTYKGPSSFVYIYYWNNSNNYDENNADTTTSTNDWEESNLNKINLNTNYLTNIGTKWSDMIEDSYWNIQKIEPNGALFNSNARMAYNYLYLNNYTKTSTMSKVALMDMTDYYYAASPNYWSKAGYTESSSRTDLFGNYGENYDYRAAVNDNWLYMGLTEWMLTRTNSVSFSAHVFKEGNIGWTYVYNTSKAIRPVFFLKNTALYSSGDGTKSNPYRITT